MALYLVSYDIREPNHDYSSLFARLRALHAEQVLPTVWLVSDSEGQAKDIATSLWAKHLQPGDSLLVQEAGSDAGWANLAASDERVKELNGLARI
jgi:hypothetical protein